MQISKTKIASIIFISMMIASMTLMTVQAQAGSDLARYLDPGVVPTNVKDVHSIVNIPAGVTPQNTFDTYSAVSASPTTVGLGQNVLFNLWCGPATQYQAFTGYKLTITKPDGTTEEFTMNSYPADMTAWKDYTPQTVGTYSYKMDFPGGFFYAGNYTIPQGAWVSSAVGGDRYLSLPQSRYYKASSSGPYTFNVTDTILPSWPAQPLPTSYWSRPVTPEYREWGSILGYYPSTGV